jgi:hypothetical protein
MLMELLDLRNQSAFVVLVLYRKLPGCNMGRQNHRISRFHSEMGSSSTVLSHDVNEAYQ